MDRLRFMFICQTIDTLIAKYIPSHHGFRCSPLSETDRALATALVSECCEFSLTAFQRKQLIEKLNNLSLKFQHDPLSQNTFNALIDLLASCEQDSVKENMKSLA